MEGSSRGPYATVGQVHFGAATPLGVIATSSGSVTGRFPADHERDPDQELGLCGGG